MAISNLDKLEIGVSKFSQQAWVGFGPDFVNLESGRVRLGLNLVGFGPGFILKMKNWVGLVSGLIPSGSSRA